MAGRRGPGNRRIGMEQHAKSGPAAAVAGWDGIRGDRRDSGRVACWGFQGSPAAGPPGGLLMLSPFQWQDLVLVPVIGMVAGFIGLRLYERLLSRRKSGQASWRPGAFVDVRINLLLTSG